MVEIVTFIVFPIACVIFSYYLGYITGRNAVETKVKLKPILRPINSRVFVQGVPGKIENWKVVYKFKYWDSFYQYTVELQTGEVKKLYEYELDRT